MEDTIYSSFIVKEINRDDGKTTLREVEKPVIGEISLKIYINGIEYASLLCLNQLTEELAIGFLYSEGVIDKFSLCNMMQSMKDFERRSEIYKTVGGVHSVLFQQDDFSVFNEDIGRHNCFDKIAGVLLRNRKMNLVEHGILFVSGRVSSEIITKVIRMGAPVLVSRSTPTSAAVHLARQYNVTLLGYVRKNSGYVYSGEERLS